MRTYALATVVLFLPALSQAGVISSFSEVGSHNINGTVYNVWHLVADSSSDWTNSRLSLVLTTGTIYQDPVGVDTESCPAFFCLFPSLQWDTYLRVPDGYPELANFTGEPTLTTTEIHASWFDTADGAVGTSIVAQISLSTDASGMVEGNSYDRDSQGVGSPFGPWFFVEGMLIPVIPDANYDGVVDAADYIILKKNFGQNGNTGPSYGDFSESGSTDYTDLQILIWDMSDSGESRSAPDPTTLSLLVTGGLVVFRHRRVRIA